MQTLSRSWHAQKRVRLRIRCLNIDPRRSLNPPVNPQLPLVNRSTSPLRTNITVGAVIRKRPRHVRNRLAPNLSPISFLITDPNNGPLGSDSSSLVQ